MEKESVKIEGTVDTVVFNNPENGWTVLELVSGDELITAVGILPQINIGEQLRLMGVWDDHATYGRQFRIEACERSLPTDAAAILTYLSNGAIKGIGPSTARKLVSKFGEKTLEIIEKDPDRLCEIKGITLKKAKTISEDFLRQFGIREAMLFLGQHGLTQAESLRAFKKYGSTLVDRVKINPYSLCSPGVGISFERADAIAQSFGMHYEDENRLSAGILHIVRHNTVNGHTCLPEKKVIAIAVNLLGVNSETVQSASDEMCGSFRLRRVSIREKSFLFLPETYEAELYCAKKLLMMASYKPEKMLADIDEAIAGCEISMSIKYNEQQKRAISAAISKGILVLTGGPGTGKTTILRAIIKLLEDMGEKVLVAAPTGRAAKRISELTDCEAKTIHRLLEAKWQDDNVTAFSRDESNPLDCDAIIIDEMSMVGSLLMRSLLRALRPGCRLIMVGDTDQLPSVGSGNVLHDIIESGKLPAVCLEEVFRQAQSSLIVTNAHRIIHGQYPDISRRDSDFFFLKKDNPFDIKNTVVDLCANRLPKAYGFSPLWNIQVLTPSHKGELGTVELNRRMQSRLNPAFEQSDGIRSGAYTLYAGDKVMQIKNNYDIMWVRDDGTEGDGVFNGDIGIVENIDRDDDSVIVRFDNRRAFYTLEEAGELELAYAVTVHKSQGSEFEAVVMPLYPGPGQLYYRNLLYTAVTRARQYMIMVGNQSVLTHMVDNNIVSKRYTGLKHFLMNEGPLGEDNLY
ncbi:MAG: ATP-dependent RecD-like DNA helicase [Clostridia bacterium]|nr:ATP-dependent RecD-like DNA helicase [Clostridia bacterium]